MCRTFEEILCEPFFDDLAYLADGASSSPEFIQVPYEDIIFDPDTLLFFKALPNNPGLIDADVRDNSSLCLHI